MTSPDPHDAGYRAACEAVERIIAPWLRSDHIQLHAGEMTAQELRSVKAIVGGIQRAISEHCRTHLAEREATCKESMHVGRDDKPVEIVIAREEALLLVRIGQEAARAIGVPFCEPTAPASADAQPNHLVDCTKMVGASTEVPGDADQTTIRNPLSDIEDRIAEAGIVMPYVDDMVRALVAREAKLKAALEPFVFGSATMETILWGGLPDDKPGTITCKLGDFRRAREALASLDQSTNSKGERDARRQEPDHG